MSLAESDGSRGFDGAVLNTAGQRLHNSFGSSQAHAHTLHITSPHLRHSPTMSRAQSPDLPL